MGSEYVCDRVLYWSNLWCNQYRVGIAVRQIASLRSGLFDTYPGSPCIRQCDCTGVLTLPDLLKWAPTCAHFPDSNPARLALNGYFFLRALPRAPFAADAPMAKSSIFLPDLIAADSHRGLRPRPAHVSDEFSGLRYLGATGPPRVPVGFFRRS
jgi:hypothetical protein